METFELNLSMDELKKRTHKDYLITKKFLKADAPEYLALKEGDQLALKHLVKAAAILEKINMQLDCKHNLAVKEFLEEEIKKGNKQAELTKILFDAQKGINAIDTMSNPIRLIKGIDEKPGKGVYPEDLSKEEFHTVLIRMIKEGKVDEVKAILTQRSVVVRAAEDLAGIDYVDYFHEDFAKMADELELAAKFSTNSDFNEYLILQAKALRTADPMLDAFADKKWATLQDTPLEFTITRENYEDEMTGTIVENKELSQALEEHGISPIPKDFLGGRVGIVNKKGTKDLIAIKEFLPTLAQNMPYADEYEQTISADSESDQTMVDVDMVMAAGDVGQYRGGITLAENLPNSDKLSLTIGGGRRNVYHKTLRNDKSKSIEMYKNVLDSQQVKYLTENDYHYFTVGHENAHTLGAHKNNAKLGEYRNILEENKADVAAISFVDKLTELGFYTQKERKGILTNFVLYNFLLAKPDMSVAHRVRQVMQCKYLADNGAYYINDEGKIHVNIDKVVPICRKMLEEVVRIQIDGDYDAAEDYVNRNFIWTDDMEYISNILKEQSNTLNKILRTPLADFLRNN